MTQHHPPPPPGTLDECVAYVMEQGPKLDAGTAQAYLFDVIDPIEWRAVHTHTDKDWCRLCVRGSCIAGFHFTVEVYCKQLDTYDYAPLRLVTDKPNNG